MNTQTALRQLVIKCYPNFKEEDFPLIQQANKIIEDEIQVIYRLKRHLRIENGKIIFKEKVEDPIGWDSQSDVEVIKQWLK